MTKNFMKLLITPMTSRLLPGFWGRGMDSFLPPKQILNKSESRLGKTLLRRLFGITCLLGKTSTICTGTPRFVFVRLRLPSTRALKYWFLRRFTLANMEFRLKYTQSQINAFSFKIYLINPFTCQCRLGGHLWGMVRTSRRNHLLRPSWKCCWKPIRERGPCSVSSLHT